MCISIDGKMQLSLNTTALFAVLFDFLFAFTKDPQSGGINHQVCDFTPGGGFETDINQLCALTDTAVIRAVQQNAHQGKNGINNSLSGPQCEPGYKFNHQNGGDGEI